MALFVSNAELLLLSPMVGKWEQSFMIGLKLRSSQGSCSLPCESHEHLWCWGQLSQKHWSLLKGCVHKWHELYCLLADALYKGHAKDMLTNIFEPFKAAIRDTIYILLIERVPDSWESIYFVLHCRKCPQQFLLVSGIHPMRYATKTSLKQMWPSVHIGSASQESKTTWAVPL